MRSKDAHRDHRGEGFCDDQTKAGLGWLQIAVESARAFGEDQGRLSGSQNPNQRLQGTAIAAFLIDGNDIQLGQEPPPKPVIEQRFASEKENRAIGSVAGQRRIEEALMIHRQNHRPTLEHAFPVQNAKSEKDFREQTRECVSEPIVEIHGKQNGGSRFPVEAAVPAATPESIQAIRPPTDGLVPCASLPP